ncbi:hypothetical protein ACOME3_001497 [Neoechinorhynchus agilis]
MFFRLFLNQVLGRNTQRLGKSLSVRRTAYVFERINRPFAAPVPKNDPDREIDLDRDSYVYRVVEHEDDAPWGDIEVILTEYLEGIGHKGEVVSVSRELFYYYLWPSELADYKTEENMKKFEEERKLLVGLAKVSAYALKMKKLLEAMDLAVLVPKIENWSVDEESIEMALRTETDIKCKREAISLLDQDISNKSGIRDFVVKIKINDLTSANLKCHIKLCEEHDLWDEFNLKKKYKPL